MADFNEKDFLAKVNGNTEDRSGEVADATRQLTPEEQRSRLGELLENSPSRQRARFTPDFKLTKKYREMVEAGESTVLYQKYGAFTDAVRQSLIDHSLEIPLSESVKQRDLLAEQIQSLEAQIDNFSVESTQAKVDELTALYSKKVKGCNAHQRATLQAEYNEAVDALELEGITKPKNELKVQRYEAVEKYKVFDNRIKLYVSCNKEAIAKRLEEARNREIDSNLLALAEYMEG